jgi:cellulose synthase (UDP-forming)
MQSGIEALKRGWHGMYLPIVGAVGQHSPEDVPNVYKQRGTWAIDTVRLVVWGKLRGLNLRQHAQFLELFFYYLHAFAVFIFIPCIIGSMLGYVPFQTDGLSFVEHVVPVILASEAWMLALNRPYNDRRRRQRHPIRDLWRMRVIWTGLSPVYIKATVQAILGGPSRKPVYKVTRKQTDARWYWGQTLPQTTVLVIVFCAVAYALRDGTVPSPIALLPVMYWGGLYVAQFAGFVARGWYGVINLRGAVRAVPLGARAERPSAQLSAAQRV